MFKVAVCDDEYIIASQIEELIYDIAKRERISVDVDVFYTGTSLEKSVIEGEKYDLIYLDIQMEAIDGISTAKNLRKMDENVILVFVSGYDKYIMELFQLDVFSFIKKPINCKIFEKIFIEANRKTCSKNFYYVFRYRNNEYKIPCRDILYFESKGRQINVHIRNGDVEVFNGKLSDVEKNLKDNKNPFLRIHQSFLVNYHMIKSRSKTDITLITNGKLPISEERQKEFSQEYGRLLGGEINV